MLSVAGRPRGAPDVDVYFRQAKLPRHAEDWPCGHDGARSVKGRDSTGAGGPQGGKGSTRAGRQMPEDLACSVHVAMQLGGRRHDINGRE